MAVALGEIAEFLGAKLLGDSHFLVEGVAELKQAGPQQLAFLANPKYAPQLGQSRAGAFLLNEAEAAKIEGRNRLVSKDPYRDFAKLLARYFDHREHPALGIHPTAIVHPSAELGPELRVGAYAVIEAGVKIGARSIIYPFCYLGSKVRLGEDCLLYTRATLLEDTVLGHRVILQPGVVLGGDGFGFAPNPPSGYLKIPQTGNVVIEDDVEIQANACVDRAVLGSTRIGRGSKLDNMVQIAHNVLVGEHSVFASQAAISGSTTIGNWVTFAGQSAAAGHLHIGDQAIVTGQAGAGKDVPAKAMVSGSPAQPTLEHHRGLAETARLPELRKRVKALEQKLQELEKRLGA